MSPPILRLRKGRTVLSYIIDDDQATCVTMTRLMQSVGILVKTFPEPKHFFVADLQDMPACLVMDVRLRGESGLTVQRRIRTEGFQIPVIFATCHGDIATSVSAMKAGAVDFLTKPFREQEMLDAVIRAIEIDREHMARDRQHIHMIRCYKSLTSREREIVGLIVGGLRGKQMAEEMGISEVTVKIHKRNAMKKMETRSLAEFVRKLSALGLCRPELKGGSEPLGEFSTCRRLWSLFSL